MHLRSSETTELRIWLECLRKYEKEDVWGPFPKAPMDSCEQRTKISQDPTQRQDGKQTTIYRIPKPIVGLPTLYTVYFPEFEFLVAQRRSEGVKTSRGQRPTSGSSPIEKEKSVSHDYSPLDKFQSINKFKWHLPYLYGSWPDKTRLRLAT